MTQREQILRALEEGPGTTADMVDATGLPRKHCCAILRALWQAGKLKRTGPAYSTSIDGRKTGPHHIYELTTYPEGEE